MRLRKRILLPSLAFLILVVLFFVFEKVSEQPVPVGIQPVENPTVPRGALAQAFEQKRILKKPFRVAEPVPVEAGLTREQKLLNQFKDQGYNEETLAYFKKIIRCLGPDFIEDSMNADFKDFEAFLWQEAPEVVQFFEDGLGHKDTPVSSVQRTRQGKFFYALALAGLLDGKEIQNDFVAAEAVMDEVIEQDPKNLAPLLFRMILARKKSPKESIEPWLDAADEANFYDDYTRDFAQVLRLATQRPVFYLQVVGAWSISPMPNYRPMVELFQSLGVRSSRYGVLMLQQGLEAKGRGSDIDWSVVPYEFGLLGIKKGDPGKEKLYPRAKDLLKKYGIQNKGTEFLKLLDSPDCSMQKFLDYLAEI